MGRETAYKLIIVAVTAGLCLLASGAWFTTRPEGGVRDFVDPGRLPGTELDEPTARLLFSCLTSRSTPRHRYDRESVVALIPDQEVFHPWPEHGHGKLLLKTNAQGFREDRDTDAVPSAYRILITGDSHTEGFVWNHESMAKRLEDLLDREGGPSYEVINAGVGATGPYNHLGVLRRELDLQPDLVLCVLFTGNDFANALVMHDFFTKRERRPRPAGYADRLMDTIADLGMSEERWGRSIVGNGFQQAHRFKHFPEEAEIALRAAVEWYQQMADLCASRDIAFAAVVLPSKPDVDDDDGPYTERILRGLELSADEYGLNRRLGWRFARMLEQRGIPVIDTTRALDVGQGPYFWNKDYHLSVEGCRVAARMLRVGLTPLVEH